MFCAVIFFGRAGEKEKERGVTGIEEILGRNWKKKEQGFSKIELADINKNQ